MARKAKNTQELLIPAASGWQRWNCADGIACNRVAEFEGEVPGGFGREAAQRILALPATRVWVLPAWLKGDAEHLGDMAALHLERVGIRTDGSARSVDVEQLTGRDGAQLTSIRALKDQPTPLADFERLPDRVILHAQCYPLPANCIVIYRELGRLVVVITHGNAVLYCSPISSAHLDQHALSEVNHICLQLGFQGVLSPVEGVVLWLEDEGDVHQVRRVTGLPAQRMAMPTPVLPPDSADALMPADVLAARARQEVRTRTRLVGLSAGLVAAAALAVMAALIALAVHERDGLRDRIAELSPRAAMVLDQKRSWIEASPAVDPASFPMQMLLNCMEPSASGEVAVTHFEATPQRILLRGRTAAPAAALQYAREISEVEALMAFAWEAPPPEIASDNSATFELKGARGP